jgi:hypothetical protein
MESQKLDNVKPPPEAKFLPEQPDKSLTKKKKKINWWMVSTIVLAIILIGGGYFLVIKKPQKKQIKTTPTPHKAMMPTATAVPTTPATPTPPTLPSPTQVTQNYPRPSNWKTVTIPEMKISLCLPPKWVVGTEQQPITDYVEIFFERDPQYRPRATSIRKMAYSGGSRREEYINSKVQYEYEPEKLKKETTVQELVINGRSVLKITIPSFLEELVFVISNSLYSFDIDYKNLVNDSRSAFEKDIYTIVGCIESL